MKGRHLGEHDWLAREYVDEWIARDVTRDDERRPMLQQMLALAPFAADRAIRVLDVGAGYGVVTEEVLKRFPHASVTLLDYSEPMFEHARRRLEGSLALLTFVLRDLCDPSWTSAVDGPFDLAVSAIAIHNLRKDSLMAAVYRAVRSVLEPGGIFLDYDLTAFSGGTEAHLRWLREAGFASAECAWESPPLAVLVARNR